MSFRSRLALGVAVACLLSLSAHAQVRPTNNPTYIPQGVLGSQTISTVTTSTPYLINGDGTLYLRVAGTFTGLTAQVQVSEFRASTGSAVWTVVPVDTVGGPRKSTITGTGLYRINVSGMAQVRLNVTAIATGSLALTQVSGAGNQFVASLPANRATYSIAIKAFAPASSSTDFFSLTGSATATVRLTKVRCSGIATAIAAQQIVGIRRSTANTTGTSLASSIAARDSANPTASALPQSYASNPTTGTGAGVLRNGYLQLNAAASTTYGAMPLEWAFGEAPGEQEVVLRGVTEVFALNGDGASWPSGVALDCQMDWTEE